VSNTSRDDVLDRVRKLLAKAEAKGVTEQESEALSAKAAELMARYGIEDAMLAAGASDNRKPTHKIIDIPNPYTEAKITLLTSIARPMRVQTVILESSHGKTKVYRVHMFGFEVDLQRVEIMFTSLLLQATSQVIRKTPPILDNGRRQGTIAFRDRWITGFAWAVGRRIEQAEKAAKTEAQAEQTAAGDGKPGVALVLASRDGLVEQLMNDTYPHLTSGKARNLSGGREALWDGYAAGERADIGQKSTGSSRQAIA